MKVPALYGQSIEVTFRDSGDVAIEIECAGERGDAVVLSSAQAKRLAKQLADRATLRLRRRRAAT